MESTTKPELIYAEHGLEVVHQVHPFRQTERLVKSIKDKSTQFRCALSNKLMVSPVKTPDGSLCEQSVFEAQPSFQSLPSGCALAQPKLKAEIAVFSKDSLKRLGACFKQSSLIEGTLDLIAECLCVLSPEAELREIGRVFDALEGESLLKVAGKLKNLVSEEYFLVLTNSIADDLPSQALCLARLAMLEPSDTRAFEAAFRSFTAMLSKGSIRAGGIELAEEVSGMLSSTQLAQLNSALKRYPTDARLDGLMLKEAYLRLREGDPETARSIVKALSPSMQEKILEFYDQADWGRDKLAYLAQMLSSSLEKLSQESPAVAEALGTIRRLFHAELQHLRTGVATQQSLVGLGAEVAALKKDLAQSRTDVRQVLKAQDTKLQMFEEQTQLAEADAQRSLSSLKTEVAALKRELAQSHSMLQGTKEERYLSTKTITDLEAGLIGQDSAYSADRGYIFSYKAGSDKLYRTSLSSGEQSCQSIPSYKFKLGSCWSELPGGDLLITGGIKASEEVVKIDTRTLAVSAEQRMVTPRYSHSAVYHAEHLYLLGGYNHQHLRECERFVCAQGCWEPLPPLPTACSQISGVVLRNCLYALGGFGGGPIDLIQSLNLVGLTWELLQVRLPYPGQGVPCFQLKDTQIWFVMKKTLYSFVPHTLQVEQVKTLSADISSFRGPSYFSSGTLYCSNYQGPPLSLEIGSLS
jgi:hypothetical protein